MSIYLLPAIHSTRTTYNTIAHNKHPRSNTQTLKSCLSIHKRHMPALFQTATEIRKQYQISIATLRRWSEDKRIRCARYGKAGKRLYHIHDVEKHLGVSATPPKTQNIVYARVSSAHQKEDLQRQIDDLKCAFPDHIVLYDIASGLNYTRKGFQTLLERTLKGMVGEVVVMHKDRLCRYGIELLESIFKHTNTKFLVYGKNPNMSSEQELADDLLAITTVFVARNNGKRAARNKRRRKRMRNGINQDPGVPHQETATNSSVVVRSSTVDVQ